MAKHFKEYLVNRAVMDTVHLAEEIEKKNKMAIYSFNQGDKMVFNFRMIKNSANSPAL